MERKSPLKSPEQLLAYRSLQELLAAKPAGVHAVAPTDSVLAALQSMADNQIGFLVVLDGGKLVGVFSERDYARKVELAGKAAKDVQVRDVMVDKVVSVTPEHTVPQCMAVMHDKSFRHLPVVDEREAHRRAIDSRPAEGNRRAPRAPDSQHGTREADDAQLGRHRATSDGPARPSPEPTSREEHAMSFLIVLVALVFLMFVAYRGYSVIMFAPVAALLAVLLTDPGWVLPMFSGVFMDKMVGFVKLYFPVFMLGAIFGKVIELSGFSKSIVSSVIRIVGRERAMLSIVVVCAVLTYGGVSLFVVVFAVYPFAAEMFRQSGIPKRLIPGTIALGAFTFTMDSLAGHAADPEHHSDDILQDDDLRCAVARHHRRGLHSRDRARLPRMAPPAGSCSRRGLRQRTQQRTGARLEHGEPRQSLDRDPAAHSGGRAEQGVHGA